MKESISFLFGWFLYLSLFRKEDLYIISGNLTKRHRKWKISISYRIAFTHLFASIITTKARGDPSLLSTVNNEGTLIGHGGGKQGQWKQSRLLWHVLHIIKLIIYDTQFSREDDARIVETCRICQGTTYRRVNQSVHFASHALAASWTMVVRHRFACKRQ